MGGSSKDSPINDRAAYVYVRAHLCIDGYSTYKVDICNTYVFLRQLSIQLWAAEHFSLLFIKNMEKPIKNGVSELLLLVIVVLFCLVHNCLYICVEKCLLCLYVKESSRYLY